MIVKPTVVITGAGASCPYGFPIGWQLVRNLVEHPFTDVNGATDQEHRGIDTDFRRHLAESQMLSIDAFLQQRSQYREWGAMRIAQEILRAEAKCDVAFMEREDDWFRILWSHMHGRSARDFRMNEVTFITFNYDRLLEQLLHTAMHATFGSAVDDPGNYMKVPDVLHLHGSAGKYIFEADTGDGVFWGTQLDAFSLKPHAETMRMHWEDHDANIWRQAQELVRNAEHVIVLGVAQATQSLRRLFRGRDPGQHAPASIVATAYGLTSAERSQLSAALQGTPRCGLSGEKCSEVLRGAVDWNDLAATQT